MKANLAEIHFDQNQIEIENDDGEVMSLRFSGIDVNTYYDNTIEFFNTLHALGLTSIIFYMHSFVLILVINFAFKVLKTKIEDYFRNKVSPPRYIYEKNTFPTNISVCFTTNEFTFELEELKPWECFENPKTLTLRRLCNINHLDSDYSFYCRR